MHCTVKLMCSAVFSSSTQFKFVFWCIWPYTVLMLMPAGGVKRCSKPVFRQKGGGWHHSWQAGRQCKRLPVLQEQQRVYEGMNYAFRSANTKKNTVLTWATKKLNIYCMFFFYKYDWNSNIKKITLTVLIVLWARHSREVISSFPGVGE